MDNTAKALINALIGSDLPKHALEIFFEPELPRFLVLSDRMTAADAKLEDMILTDNLSKQERFNVENAVGELVGAAEEYGFYRGFYAALTSLFAGGAPKETKEAIAE